MASAALDALNAHVGNNGEMVCLQHLTAIRRAASCAQYGGYRPSRAYNGVIWHHVAARRNQREKNEADKLLRQIKLSTIWLHVVSGRQPRGRARRRCAASRRRGPRQTV